MVEQKRAPRHEIVMLNRKTLEISGVVNVESFDSEEFLLQTECGFLAIRGQNLHMKNLSLETGEVAIEGTVFHMGYIDEGNPAERAKGFFSKLFK
ncbi:sporulation protein YabP [Bacillaceae bacterium]